MKNYALFFALVVTTGVVGCRRDSPARKIIEGAPLGGDSISVPPLNAVQSFHALQRDVIGTVVAITRRTTAVTPSFPELVGYPTPIYPYQFTTTGRYGTVTVTFKFQNNSNTDIDPIAAPSSTSTIKYIVFNSISLSGSPFNGSATGSPLIMLATEGDINSEMRLTGVYEMTATTYTVTFTFSSPGGVATFTGLSGGIISLSGAGPGGAINGAISANTARELNGTLSWDGHNGEIHLEDNSAAVLLWDNIRYLFD